MMCGGSRDDHILMHMRPFSDAAQNLGGGLSQISADMMDTGRMDCGQMAGKRSCGEELLSGKRARNGHCVGVDACIEGTTGDPRNPRIGKFKFRQCAKQLNAYCYALALMI